MPCAIPCRVWACKGSNLFLCKTQLALRRLGRARIQQRPSLDVHEGPMLSTVCILHRHEPQQRRAHRSTRARLCAATTGAATRGAEALTTQDKALSSVFLAASAVTAVFSVAALVAPSQLCQLVGNACPTVQAAALMRGVAASWWPTAAVLYVLQAAVIHHRTASDTYKRLASFVVVAASYLALSIFASFDLLHSAPLLPWLSVAACVVVSAAAVTIARVRLDGKSWRKLLPPTDQPQAMTYWVLMAAAPVGLPSLSLMFSHGAAVSGRAAMSGWSGWAMVLAMSSLASGVAAAFVAFTLKDAAERNRLGGSTFVILRASLTMTGTAFGALLAIKGCQILYRLSQGVEWLQILFVVYALVSLRWLHGDYINLMKSF